MKRYLLLILLFLGTTLADQTFDNETAILNNVYYDVPFEVQILENNNPTDFYVSVGSGTFWEKASSTFGWGEFTPTDGLGLQLDFLGDNLKLGIHTGIRNSGTFSTLPTDESDATFTIRKASATFNDLDFIWLDDVFYLSWEVDKYTLPDRILIEYRETSGTWITLEDIDSSIDGINISNSIIDEDVAFRLTYMGEAYGYNIAYTESTFLDPFFEITNKLDIENVIWGDNQEIEINYNKERLSEYTYVLVYQDNQVIDTINYNDNSSTYITEDNYNGTVTLEFITKRGDLLETLNITSINKFFEVSPLTDEEYSVNSTIPIDWSYSNNYELIQTEIKRNSNTFYSILNSEWLLDRNYNYAVTEQDTSISFRFTVSDGVTEITRLIGPISTFGHCREDELLEQIDILENNILELSNNLDSLQGVVDSLENISDNRVYVVLIKDIPLDVEVTKIIESANLQNIPVVNNQINIDITRLTHLYIVDILGNIVYEKSGDIIKSPINISDFNSGMYLVLGLGNNGIIEKYKFIK